MPSKLTKFSSGGGCGCKVSPSVLSRLIGSSPAMQFFPNLLVGSDKADDAAVYRINKNQALVATTDFFTPIVDNPFDFGRIAAANALSDIYAMGGNPIMALSVLGFPVGEVVETDISQVLEGASNVCGNIAIPIAGGHSINSKEMFYGLVALGLVNPDNLKMNSHGRHNDRLILTKPLGVGVISAGLQKGVVSSSTYQQFLDLTTQLNTVGCELAKLDVVNAMTDVTGFGLLGHLLEMCQGSKLSAELNLDSIPIIAVAEELTKTGVKTGASTRNWESYKELVQLTSTPTWIRDILCDPQTSGGLLISCHETGVGKVMDLLHMRGFPFVANIGRLQMGPPNIRIN